MIETKHPFFQRLQNSKNILLVKDTVGKSKQTVRDLPPVDHSYGYKTKPDKQGAGVLLTSWQNHQRSTPVLKGKDYQKLNRLLLAQKRVQKEKAKFKKVEGKLKLKGGRENARSAKILGPPYGIKNRPSTPIDRVIQNQYANEASLAKFLVYQKFLEKQKPMKKVQKSQSPKVNEEIKEVFKLRRFSKVKPIVNTYNGRNNE